MKTKMLLVGFVLSVFIQIQAQDRKFNFGFKIAPAVSWLGVDGNNASSNGGLARFNWGFIGTYNFSENFSLVSGFNINSLGGNVKYGVSPDNREVTHKYSEFQLPAIFQMQSKDISAFKIFAQLGLGEGLIMSAKAGNGDKISGSTRNFNTSYIIAAGTIYNAIGGVNLLGAIKYNGGLVNINKDKQFKARPSFVELTIGVLF